MGSPDTAALAELEGRVDAALASGTAEGLEILGYGEISCVVAWRGEGGPAAAKRMPPFDTRERFEAYRSSFETYLAALAGRGIRVIDSRLDATAGRDGMIVAWCLQPLLPPASLGPAWLAAADDRSGRRLLDELVRLILGCVGPGLGLDGQLSNWAVVDDEVLYFDVTTPMMRTEDGREVLDTELFLASLPWALRGLARRFLLSSILDTYYQPRTVVCDLLANLIKEGVSERLPAALEIVNAHLADPLDEREVRAYYRSDARMWQLLQDLRRLDRGWQRRVRRRPYPFLLPGRVERRV